MLPAVVTSWGAWRAQYPDTDVVSTDTGYDRNYGPGAAYCEYPSSPTTMFPVTQNSDALPPKAWTFGIRHAGGAKAYALTDLMRYRVVVDQVGDAGVIIVATGNPLELHGHDATAGPVSYSAGLTARAYATEEVRFQPHQDEEGSLVDAAGNQWQVAEDGLRLGGRVLSRVTSHQSYWFAWQAFFPDGELWRPPEVQRPLR